MSVLLHWAVSSFTPGNGPRAWHIESVHENFTGFRSLTNHFNFYTCFWYGNTFSLKKKKTKVKQHIFGKNNLVEFLYKDEISVKETLKVVSGVATVEPILKKQVLHSFNDIFTPADPMLRKQIRCPKSILVCLANPEILILVTKIWSLYDNLIRVTHTCALGLFCCSSLSRAFCPCPWPFNMWRLREREKIDCPNIDPLHNVGATWLFSCLKAHNPPFPTGEDHIDPSWRPVIMSRAVLDFMKKAAENQSPFGATFPARIADSNFSFSLILSFEVPDLLSIMQHIVIFIY